MNHTAKRRAVIAALAGTMILSNAQAGSVAGNGGATEVTQILNNGELVIQSSQLYTEVQQTLQTMNDVHTQLQNLIAAPQQLWGQAQQDLIQLTQLANQASVISYAAGSIDQQFRNAFPGYAQSAGATNYGSQYKALISKQLDGLNTALQSVGLNASQFATERSAIQQIQSISAGSPGALQAVQAGNMIASQTIDQLQKVRQMLAAQMQSQANYMAAQAQIQSNQTDATQTLMKQGNGTVRQSGQSGFKGF